MFALRNVLALMVTAALGLGAVAGGDASVRAEVETEARAAAQTVTRLAAEIQAQVLPDGETPGDRLQTRTRSQLETQTQLQTQTQEQLRLLDPAGPQQDEPVQTRAGVQVQQKSHDRFGSASDAGPNPSGSPNRRAGR
jgi:hypothetical protein